MATNTEISQLFVALFNRAIDSATFKTYSGRTYDQSLIGSILDTNPTVRSLTTQDFVELFYKNALGKDLATDAAGIQFWVNEITTKSWSKEQFLDAIFKNLDDYVNNRVQNVTDVDVAGLAVFNAKIKLSNHASETVGDADPYYLTFGSGLENITAQTAQTAYETALKTLENVALRNPAPKPGGNTVTLTTTSSDFLPTNPNPDESGATTVGSTPNDDTVNARVDTADASTLKTTSKIDGGAGHDTLNVDMKANFTGLTSGGSITNIETITLNNIHPTQSVSFNAQGIQNVYTYNINGANGIKLSNVSYNDALEINLNGVKNDTTQITFNTTPTGGRLNVGLTDVGYDSTDNKINNHKVDVGTGIGQMHIRLTGNNYVDIANEGVNRITVGGTGSLDTNLSKGVTYFNGANAAGNLTVRAADGYSTAVDGTPNGDNVFTFFATGDGDDNVEINVQRLDQNALVNLGRGEDTLTLTGDVDRIAQKQYYNLNTVENLVFKNTGDSLLLDLGTTTNEGVTTTDRSANLKSIAFENGASAQVTSLGQKQGGLAVIYKGAMDNQRVLVDHGGTVNLTLQGAHSGSGTTEGARGAGIVNLSDAKVVNVDLTGQGFEGFLSAGQATNLNITNLTADKALKLKANTLTEKNDFSSVTTLSINTEAQDNSRSINVATPTNYSVDLSKADLASLSNVTLRGTGGINLGSLSNSGGITIDGSNYSGRLVTEDIFAGRGTLKITTKGAITTGNLTGSNVEIDLSKAITTTDNQFNNKIGTIFIGNGASSGSGTDENGEVIPPTLSGSLKYTTGISGTKVTVINANGQLATQDTQDIVVQATNATLGLNGQGGVDKFNIRASALTNKLTVTGDLGSVPQSESSNGNYDSAKIDLSQTSGVTLDLSGFVVNNPTSGGGINIQTSQGKDTIVLNQGSNFDVIAAKAGGKIDAVATAQTLTLTTTGGTFGVDQGVTINGVTFTATGANKSATNLAADIKAFIEGTTAPTHFSITGTQAAQKSFTDLNSSWTISANNNILTFTSKAKVDTSLPDFLTEKIENQGQLDAATLPSSPNAGLDARGVAGANASYTVPGTAVFTAAATGETSGSAKTHIYDIQITDANDQTLTYALELQVKVRGTTAFQITEAELVELTANLLEGGVGGSYTIRSDLGMKINDLQFKDNSGAVLAKMATADDSTPNNKYKKFDMINNAGNAKAKLTDLTGEKVKLGVGSTAGSFSILEQNVSTTDTDLIGGVSIARRPDVPATNAGSGGGVATDGTILTGTDYKEAVYETYSLDFAGVSLSSGQFYTISTKTVKPIEGTLSGADIAQAFTLNAGVYTINGVQVAVSGAFSNSSGNLGNAAWKVSADGTKLVATEATAGSNSTLTDFVVRGNSTVPASPELTTTLRTTTTGSDGTPKNADSFITIGGNITAGLTVGDNNLDSITGFDLGVDKLKMDKYATNGSFTRSDLAAVSDIARGAGDATGVTVTAAANSTQFTTNITASDGTSMISGNILNGVATFSEGTTLTQKFAILKGIAANKVVGFNDGNDFYVIGGGNQTATTTDDVTIKLTGVGTINDLATLL